MSIASFLSLPQTDNEFVQEIGLATTWHVCEHLVYLPLRSAKLTNEFCLQCKITKLSSYSHALLVDEKTTGLVEGRGKKAMAVQLRVDRMKVQLVSQLLMLRPQHRLLNTCMTITVRGRCRFSHCTIEGHQVMLC